MRKDNGFTDKRLIDALDYIDPRFIAEAARKLKERPIGYAPADEKASRKVIARQLLKLAACLLILSAAIPVITYVLQNFADFTGWLMGDTSEESVPELTLPETPPTETTDLPPKEETTEETTAEETTEEIKQVHNGSEGLIYSLNEDGASYTLVSRGECTAVNVNVASVCNGLPVTAIGDGALADYTEMLTIKVPNSVTSIGEGAFKNCTNLNSVGLPDTVSYIGANAFENCTSMWVLFLPDSLEVIEAGLFTNCSGLRTVEARNKLKRIITGAFYGCTSLTGFGFNGTGSEWSNVKKGSNWHIGSAIRQVDCNTGSIKINPPATEILENDGSEGLEYSLSGIEATLVSLGTCKEKNIVIASTYGGYPVKWIGKGVFEGCTDVESITIPETVFSIGSLAFADCTSLESIYIPASVGRIQSDSFRGCLSLRSIEVAADNEVYMSVNNCLIQKDNGTLVLACATSVLPNDGSITTIDSYAFSGISELTSLVIPEGVTAVKANAIHDCRNLRSISLPSTLTDIDRRFVSGGESIESLKFPRGNSLYSGEGCCLIDKNTKTVLCGFSGSVIPDWVTAIGEEAFRGCTGLVSINIPTSVRTIGESAFRECTSLEKIKVEGSTLIMSYAFMHCSSLREVDLGNKTTFGYGYAHIFAYCTSLESIRIPESVTRLVFQFEGCSKLSEVILHDNITEFSGGAFSGCSLIKSVYLGSKVTKLPNNVFDDCLSLTEIIYGGTQHDWYTLPKGSAWRAGALSLKSIKCTDGIISSTATQPMAGSFGLLYEISEDGKSATLVGFKDGIGRYSEIEIASTYYGTPVTSISDEVLEQLRKYSGVLVISSNMEQLGDRLFALNPKLKKVVITPGVKSIGDETFLGCLELAELTFQGYKSAWEKIEKGERWNYGAAFTVVHCLDGDVAVEQYSDTVDGTAGLKYYVSSDGYAIFAGIGTCTENEIAIATNYMGYPVKSISQGALRGNTAVKSVVIPDCIEEIARNAFYDCTSLVSVSVPDSVKSVGEHAFAGCSSLTEIKLPASILKIEQYAFARCTSLRKIKIPESVTEIGYNAFAGSDSLETLYIPKSVTSLGWMDFTEINNFEIDPKNPKYAWMGNCFIDKETKTLITMFKDAVIPDDGSVEIIGEEAFGWERGITELILPEGVKYMRNSSYYGFDGIEYLHLPSTFEGFAEYALSDCFDLKKITVAEGNPYYYVAGNCLIEKATGKIILALEGFVIPDDGSIKHIGDRAFADLDIESITIPEGVISIGNGAFSGRASLKEIVLPESLESIGNGAFRVCISLKSIKLGENVKHIGNEAFAGCEALEEIVLPKQIESIGDSAFMSCRSLKSVILPQGFEGADDIFSGCTNLEQVVLPDGLKRIGNFFFGRCENIKNLVIPESVTEIGYYAFYYCISLESIVIPKGVTLMDEQVFNYCNELEDFRFAGTIEEWKAVTKTDKWKENSPFTKVHCTDGDTDA